MSRLSRKQRIFAEEYILCLNATEAARRAGYEGNDNTLANMGWQNLRKREISTYIDEILEQQAMSRAEILGRLSAHARADLGDFLDPDTGAVDLVGVMERGLTPLIKKWKQRTTTSKDGDTTVSVEIELYDAQAALVHLGRAYGMFTERLQVEDWRSRAIEDIRAGRLDYGALAAHFDDDLATELFRLAGIPPEALTSGDG